jgi:5'-3' exonuclease
MSDRYQNFVIDGTNAFFRSIHRTLRLTKNWENQFEKFCRFPIEDFLRHTINLVDEYGYQNSTVYFLFDNPDSAYKFRKMISEGHYKHSRKKNGAGEHVYLILNILVNILKEFSDNYRVVSAIGLEADDLTLPVQQHIDPGQHNKALFVSVDLDWARNIDDTRSSHWFNWSRVYTERVFFQEYGFNPRGNALKLYKAIHGDTADCIQNAVPRLPKETLIQIVEKFKDVDDLFQNFSRLETTKEWKLRIKDAENQIRINYQMVDFFPIETPLEEMLHECKHNKEALRQWYEMLDSEMLLNETITYKEFMDDFGAPRRISKKFR